MPACHNGVLLPLPPPPPKAECSFIRWKDSNWLPTNREQCPTELSARAFLSSRGPRPCLSFPAHHSQRSCSTYNFLGAALSPSLFQPGLHSAAHVDFYPWFHTVSALSSRKAHVQLTRKGGHGTVIENPFVSSQCPWPFERSQYILHGCLEGID